MPKSGSTFLAQVLHELTGFIKPRLVYASGRSEQELYLPQLLRHYWRPTVHQCHARATSANIELIKRFRIRPVVLVRNLFDVVVSIRDHFRQESTETFLCYADERFERLDEASQYSFIIDLCLPWYLNFFVSWSEATRAGQVDALWVTYEDLIGDPQRTIATIAEFLDVPCDGTGINEAIDRALSGQIRFNKGVSGRGRQALTEEQRAAVRALTCYYPGVDFSKVGL